MIVNEPNLVSFLSQSITLQPSTVIISGTLASVGFARITKYSRRPGEEFTIEVPSVGMLVNFFEAGRLVVHVVSYDTRLRRDETFQYYHEAQNTSTTAWTQYRTCLGATVTMSISSFCLHCVGSYRMQSSSMTIYIASQSNCTRDLQDEQR